ncbi:MAG TPA: MazG family protein [Gemmatimonadales bacterium]|jgi:MazG family protein
MQGDSGFGDILELVRDLRKRCDFDRALTLDTLRPYLREELAEFEEAQDENDEPKAAAELGDIFLHCAFQIVLAEERGAFTLKDVSDQLVAKMKGRHPHLYEGGAKPDWEKQKAESRKQEAEKRGERVSVLGRLPGGMPELERAYRFQERAASVGFDWPGVAGPLDKLEEEVAETRENPSGEIGDVLFAAVNVARKAGIHPSIALRDATSKFVRRFQQVEELAEKRGMDMSSAGLAELDKLWDEVKAGAAG